MITGSARLLERYFNLDVDRSVMYLNRLVITLAAMSFVLMATIIVAFDDIFPAQTGLSSVRVGDIAPFDVFAPESRTYVSQILTEQRREAAAAAVDPIYDPPNPNIAREQTNLAQQILNFIDNVRRSPFDTREQKIRDIDEISALGLDEPTIQHILEIDTDAWQDIADQIVAVLERVFRNDIREADLPVVRSQLPNQVSVRFSDRDVEVVVAVVRDLIRPNTTLNEEATQAARANAAANVPQETRSFERGQSVIAGGVRIGAADYEALEQLGLLQDADIRLRGVARALLASVIVMVVTGLYMARFTPSLLYDNSRMLMLMAAIFLIVLLGARFGLSGQIYIYPTASMALLFVAIHGPTSALIGTLGLAFMIGIMAGNSLEITTLVAVGGIIGALTLRRSERLNSFFFAGLMVAISNLAVVALFNFGMTSMRNPAELLVLVASSLFNGILTAAAATAGMYIVTLLFNLPTALKLVELSQPNQPLLQRLLREAPGTYQHSLQVGNLAEQATNAIGGNAELVHVAALYHDIGKILNPAFFTENQRDIGNPHDSLNDPYRSADIIIGHVTGGDEMAKQYRLPNRIRDFIREHHGTSEVFVFYQQALILAGDDESMVDPDDFRYPGPRPQSKETAVLLLADSCEAAVRSRQPKTKQEIEEVVMGVIDGRRKTGQLDDSGLTLNDLKIIQDIFIEMLQAVYHPRINYTEAIAKVRQTRDDQVTAETLTVKSEVVDNNKKSEAAASKPEETSEKAKSSEAESKNGTINDDDDAPLPEVPRLRRTGNTKPLPPPSQLEGNGREDDSASEIDSVKLPPEDKDEAGE